MIRSAAPKPAPAFNPARIYHQKHRATSLFIVLRVPSPGGGALPLLAVPRDDF